MGRKARRSRRRHSSNRGDGGGGGDRSPPRKGKGSGPEQASLFGDLPPLPIATRLLDSLRSRVDDDYIWQRGIRYAEDGRVAYLKTRGDNVEAGVRGSRRYLVSLSWPGGNPERFEGRCTCPFARRGICKHQVAMAMTLWFATQRSEEEEANAELAAAAGPDLIGQGIGADIRRPRGGVGAGSALPLWLATLLDPDETAPPPPKEGPSLPINADEPWLAYELLPATSGPLPIEVRIARLGPGMRPTRGQRIYDFTHANLQDLSREVRILPEDHLILSVLGNRSASDDDIVPPWDPGILDRLLRSMAHTREVRIQGEHLRIVIDPLQLVLVIADAPTDAEDKGICFWIETRREDSPHPVDPGKRKAPREGAIPGLRHYIPAFPGWVHLDDGTLRPLTPEGTRLLKTLGAVHKKGLPTVAEEDLIKFREREWPLIGSRYPVDILTDKVPAVVSPAPEPRLYLLEPNEMTLEIRAAFAYRVPDCSPIEVGPNSPQFLQPEDKPDITLQRSPAKEAALLAQVLQSVVASQGIEPSEIASNTDPWRLVLGGEEALTFLAEQLPILESVFTIFGDENLTRLRVRKGDLSANARVSSHVDWFDLKMGFSAGDGLASASQVLAAWRSQKRFVELDDGSFAKIPQQWLERYGMLVEEAETAGRELKGKFPSYMAALGVALQDAVGEFHSDATFEKWKNKLSHPELLEAMDPPAGLKATLRQYQQHGYTWLCWLAEQGFGGCLADDMGLGKTVQALSYIQRQYETGALKKKKVLVIAPTSVLFNWKNEIKRFCPGLKVTVYQGANRKDLWSPNKAEQADIVLTSYPLLRIDGEILAKPQWHTVILDESQYIKNAESQTTQWAFRLRADHRVVMTGTPLENRLDDLWSQFHFLMPGFLGNRKAFLANYAVRAGGNISKEVVEARLSSLRARIRPFLLRRLKQDVATELPERTEILRRVDLSPREERMYAAVRDAYRAQVFSQYGEKGAPAAKLTILEALLRLRQSACHLGLLPFEEAKEIAKREGSSKIRVLIEILEEIIAEGHKALVFSQWTSLLDLAQKSLNNARIETHRLDGSTKDRAGVVEAFQNPDGAPVFLLSLKAGGTGLNLTAADYVIHLDPWWNPAAEAQANDRAHRIGQTRPVMIIKLVSGNTVEEKVVALQQQKRALFEAAVSGGGSVDDILSQEHLQDIFGKAPEEGADPASPAVPDDDSADPVAADAQGAQSSTVTRRRADEISEKIRDEFHAELQSTRKKSRGKGAAKIPAGSRGPVKRRQGRQGRGGRQNRSASQIGEHTATIKGAPADTPENSGNGENWTPESATPQNGDASPTPSPRPRRRIVTHPATPSKPPSDAPTQE